MVAVTIPCPPPRRALWLTASVCLRALLLVPPPILLPPAAVPSKPLKAIKPMFPKASSWRIVRGDLVQVRGGNGRQWCLHSSQHNVCVCVCV